MEIIGWIRQGDKAACGGVVAEAWPTDISYGRPITYLGAAMACKKNCRIAQAHQRYTLPNGQPVPHHGHVTTGGCPLISTVNDIHGLGNEVNDAIPVSFIQDENGDWIGEFPEEYDQHFQLLDEITGEPLAKRVYRLILADKAVVGRTDENGFTEKVEGENEKQVRIEIFGEGV